MFIENISSKKLFMKFISRHFFAPKDVSFPTLESGLLWKPLDQNLLFDNDEDTCLNAFSKVSMIGQLTSLVAHWDPTEKNSPRDDVATYYCQPEFFVNVTHGVDVGISVYRGNGTLTGSIDGKVLKIKKCDMIGKAVVQGLVRSKFRCQCTEKCHVMIKVASHLSRGGTSDDRLCTLKVYD